MTGPIDAATSVADELLYPTALATDAGDHVPRSHLDRLAGAGLYGLFGPTNASGMGADRATGLEVIEILAGACLTTTFVWMQHRSALAAVADSATPGIRAEWLEPMCVGKRRAGIAVAGIRPGAPPVTARAVDGGWRVNGVVPWVTGWGLIDVVHTAALDGGGGIVWALIDATESPTLTCQRQHLVAVQASVTVTVRFQDHFVPAERVTIIERYDDWLSRDARGLRSNGSLALGVAGRCCRLLGPSPLDQDLAACRTALDNAALDRTGPDDAATDHAATDHPATDAAAMPAARAAACFLAHRAAGALVVAAGSRSILLDQHPQRLAREAAFLLVFASRPAIRKELTRLFACGC